MMPFRLTRTLYRLTGVPAPAEHREALRALPLILEAAAGGLRRSPAARIRSLSEPFAPKRQP